jgi:Domain of unknown function (DUF4304)
MLPLNLMADSVTTRAIATIRVACGSVLKPLGFHRRAPHFFRRSNDLFHCVHFQASQWGSRSSGSFTINLYVTCESLYHHWTGSALPSNPATACWPIQERLGMLRPEHQDLWWDINADSDVPRVAGEILELLPRFALPFFESYPASCALLERLQKGAALPGMTAAQLPLVKAMLLVDAGRRDEASTCIAGALVQNESSRFRSTILTIARRLQLHVAE